MNLEGVQKRSVGSTEYQNQHFSLEVEVFRNGCTSAKEAQRVRGREQKAQADVCRRLFGQCHAQGCSLKKVVSTGERQNMATYLQKTYEVSITRACRVVRFPKSMYYYKPKKDDRLLIDIVSSMAEKRPREGQDKIYQRLRLEGHLWNKKRVSRIYLKLGLNLTRKTKRRIPKELKNLLYRQVK